MVKTSRLIDGILSNQDCDEGSYISESELVSKYQNVVYRYCLNLTYQKADADDLFQDTFLRAFSLFDKITAFENPQSFLLSIATSLWKSQKRKFARRKRLAPEVDFDEAYFDQAVKPEDEIIADEETLIVRALVNNLPDKLKIPIVMYYTIEMKISEISETLGLPIGTVKTHLSRGREIIKKGLVNEYGYDK
ncbi:MAG: RNA polymerase sigma factor [Oscillospiraceae bacterium]|jgi:RNA polymerase sigma-70 factor (ECF subfamily)|nr:RNA polymerase sigma factor [Oscillospiraceae bacterium]